MEKRKVFIADRDSQFVLKAVDSLIDTCELRIAYTKEDAYAKIKNDLPDLIIIGYLEPRGDSYKLHRDLRENINTKHIPLLIVDVKPEDHLQKGWRRNEGMQMNAEGYLSRPVDPDELRKEVERIITTTMKRNKILSDALEYTEMLLLRQVENWKDKMTQLVGKNRLTNGLRR